MNIQIFDCLNVFFKPQINKKKQNVILAIFKIKTEIYDSTMYTIVKTG